MHYFPQLSRYFAIVEASSIFAGSCVASGGAKLSVYRWSIRFI